MPGEPPEEMVETRQHFGAPPVTSMQENPPRRAYAMTSSIVPRDMISHAAGPGLEVAVPAGLVAEEADVDLQGARPVPGQGNSLPFKGGGERCATPRLLPGKAPSPSLLS